MEQRRRDQLEFERLSTRDHGVTGIIATRVAYDHIGLAPEYIHELAFSLVAPLGADDNQSRHTFLPEVGAKQKTRASLGVGRGSAGVSAVEPYLNQREL